MRLADSPLAPAVAWFNARIVGLADSPRWGPLVRRRIVRVSYTGRRSGKRFTIPVGYERDGELLTIIVMAPDAKGWWRNFEGDGGPMSVQLDGAGGAERTGHAVARRDPRGRVTVTVDLGSAASTG